MTREKTCFFSGHRILEKRNMALTKSLLREEILNKINDGVTRFIAGGAVGFDTIAAEQVADIREDYTDIKLVLYLPCKNHFSRWKQADKLRFSEIMEMADEVRYVTEANYLAGCMKLRNEEMVKDADCGIVYLTRRMNSGSAQTVSYAKKKGVPYVNIAELVKKYADRE